MLRAAVTRFRYLRTSWSGVLRGSSSSLFSEAEARERFQEWCKKHDRTYSSQEEKLFRFNIFKEQLERRARQTPKDVPLFNGNRFADRTSKEFRRYCNGLSSIPVPVMIFCEILVRAVTSVQGLFKKGTKMIKRM